MNEIQCSCGLMLDLAFDPPALSVTCLCTRRHVWARDHYVENPACREPGCESLPLAYRNGYDETIFLCDEHEQARWSLRLEPVG